MLSWQTLYYHDRNIHAHNSCKYIGHCIIQSIIRRVCHLNRWWYPRVLYAYICMCPARPVVIYSQWATHVSVLVTASVGGGWKFLVTEFFFLRKNISNFFFKNVPGVLKRMQNNFFFRRGGILGCLGRPTHPGVARGRKTIHLFLWPWHVTG